ncbi:MAG: 50S ribosomal protein L9 [Oscillospiraceae bacterium]|nr:50S ribosomal protein L9 [Oscillospiraceae bacterium]
MKIILQADVKDQGKKGDLVEVSDGYARNYLFPRKLASEATPDAINAYKNREAAKARKLEEEKSNAAKLANVIKEMSVTVKAKGGAAGRLFGSVTGKEICDALKEQHGIELEKHKIIVNNPIRTEGEHTCLVKLGHENTAELKVVVEVL